MNLHQTTSDAAGTGHRVLIVDDSEDSAKILGLYLEKAGYLVDVLTDSTQCLAHLESFQPDVVLLDIAMPRIDGYDLAKQIRVRPGFGKVIVFTVSGFDDRDHVLRSLQVGCDEHFVKPIDVPTLKAGIARAHERRLKAATPIRQPGPG